VTVTVLLTAAKMPRGGSTPPPAVTIVNKGATTLSAGCLTTAPNAVNVQWGVWRGADHALVLIAREGSSCGRA